MDLRTERMRLELDRNQVLRLTDARGASIVVHDGELWVTQEGERDDRVLAAGERVTLDRDGLTVLQAFSGARVTIDRAPARGTAQASGSSPAILRPRRWYVGASNPA